MTRDPSRRLTSEERVQILARIKKGHRIVDVALDFDVTPATVSRLKNGHTAPHLRAAVTRTEQAVVPAGANPSEVAKRSAEEAAFEARQLMKEGRTREATDMAGLSGKFSEISTRLGELAVEADNVVTIEVRDTEGNLVPTTVKDLADLISKRACEAGLKRTVFVEELLAALALIPEPRLANDKPKGWTPPAPLDRQDEDLEFSFSFDPKEPK